MSVIDHHIDCEWHLDQYNWECTCGVIKNPAELRPEFKAILAAVEDAEDSLALAEHRLEEAMGTSPEVISLEEADRIMEFNFSDDGSECINTIVDLGGFNSANDAMSWIITVARGLLIRERDGWVTVFHNEKDEREAVVFTRDKTRWPEIKVLLGKLGVKEVP